MKAKQIKKLLSLTLVSAMVVSGTPGTSAIALAEDAADTISEQPGENAVGTDDEQSAKELVDASSEPPVEDITETSDGQPVKTQADVVGEQSVENTEETTDGQLVKDTAETTDEQPVKDTADTVSDQPEEDMVEPGGDQATGNENGTNSETSADEKTEPDIEISDEGATDPQRDVNADAAASKVVKVTWKDETITYDGAPHTLSAQVDVGSYENGYSIVYTDENGNEVDNPCDAGTYTAEVRLADSDYTVSGGTGKLVIEKLHVTIQIADIELVYWWGAVGSESYELFDSNEKQISEEMKMHFKNDHNRILSYNSKGTGTFDITVLEEEPAESRNFILDNKATAKGTMIIHKCPIYMEIEDQSKVYGEEDLFQFKNYVYYKSTAGEDGLYEYRSDSFRTYLQREPGENVYDENGNKASYKIYLKQTEIDNFTFVDKKGNQIASPEEGPCGIMTIEPLPISITIPDREKTYGEADPELGIEDVQISIEDKDHKIKKTEEDIKKELQETGVTLKREEGESVNQGETSYEISLSGMENASNYQLKEEKKGHLTVKKAAIKVNANEIQTVYGQVPELTYSLDLTGTDLKEEKVKNELPENLLMIEDEEGNLISEKDAAKKGVGEYNIVLNPEAESENYVIDFTPAVLKINQLPVSVSPKTGQSKVYREDDPEHYQYDVKSEDSSTTLSADDIKKELESVFVTAGQEILQREEGEDVTKEGYAYSLAENGEEYGNFKLTLVGNESFYIQPLDITIKANPQSKVYGAADPRIADSYQIILPEDTKVTEEDVRGDLERLSGNTLGRNGFKDASDDESGNPDDGTDTPDDGSDTPDDGTDTPDDGTDTPDGGTDTPDDEELVEDEEENPNEIVGMHDIELNKAKVEALTNYNITYEKAQLEIKPLSVTIIPAAKQKKIFGEVDPEYYDYTVSYDKEGSGTELDAQLIMQELGDLAIIRESGETPGTYAYTINRSDEYKTHLKNYDLTLKNETFEISPVEIVSVDSVNSRQGSFKIKTNIKGEKSDKIKTAFRITAEFPESKEITFDKKIDSYITGASEGIAFSDESGTIKVNTSIYHKTGENKEKLEWKGNLPAGAKLTITVVDANGNVVSRAPAVLEVQKTNLAFSWSGLKQDAGGFYVNQNESFHLNANESKGADELTEIVYSTADGSQISTSYHNSMNVKLTPELKRNNGTEIMQLVTANIVDTLNLNCASKAQKFYVKGPQVLPEPTKAPEKTPVPTEAPKPTAAPKPTEAPKPTVAPKPTEASKPIEKPEQTEAEENGKKENTRQAVKYEALLAPAVVKSPVYAAMTCISGMAEPGTTVTIVINGKTQKSYQLTCDRFGRFCLDKLPELSGGENSFDIYVQSPAGLKAVRHYEIPQSAAPFEITAKVNPLGKYFFDKEKTGSDVFAATPVSTQDFEEKDVLEIPLLMGMSYEVGKLIIEKQDGGIIITGKMELGDKISEEDYSVKSEKLRVFRLEPSVDDLKNQRGEEFSYGERIPLEDGETIWVTAEQEITLLEKDMKELQLFDFEESEEYYEYNKLEK